MVKATVLQISRTAARLVSVDAEIFQNHRLSWIPGKLGAQIHICGEWQGSWGSGQLSSQAQSEGQSFCVRVTAQDTALH